MLAALSLLLIVGACGKSGNSKAEDWIKLGEYDRAESELESSIANDPQDVPDRVMLAHLYLLRGASGNNTLNPGTIEQALLVLNEAAIIDSGDSGVTTGRKECYDALNKILEGADTSWDSAALTVIQKHPSPDASDGLEAAMGNIQTSDQAEQLLRAQNPSRARQKLIALLDGGDATLRVHAAERLWTTEAYAPAKPVLRDGLLVALVRAQNDAEAKNDVTQLTALGWNDVADPIYGIAQQAVANQAPATAGFASFDALIAHDDQRMGQLAATTLHNMGTSGDATQNGCTPIALGLARTLGFMHNADGAAALKSAMSRVILVDNSRFGCLDVYLGALAQTDSPDWRAIKYWYGPGGWPIFTTMFPGRIEAKRANNEANTYDSGHWNLVAPQAAAAAERIDAVVHALGPFNWFSGGRRVQYAPQALLFDTPHKATFVVDILQYVDYGHSNAMTKIATLTLVLESTGADPDQPWQITAVPSFQFNGSSVFHD
jgi:hypothetical protein